MYIFVYICMYMCRQDLHVAELDGHDVKGENNQVPFSLCLALFLSLSLSHTPLALSAALFLSLALSMSRSLSLHHALFVSLTLPLSRSLSRSCCLHRLLSVSLSISPLLTPLFLSRFHSFFEPVSQTAPKATCKILPGCSGITGPAIADFWRVS